MNAKSVSYIKNAYACNKVFFKKMVKFSLLFILVLVSFFEFIKSNFGIWIDNRLGRCIPEYSVYWVIKNINKIEKGDIVTFKTHEAIHFYELGSYFGKYVAAKEGDIVQINDKGVFINYKHILNDFVLLDKIGVEKESLYRTLVLDVDQYFVIGKAKNSYDSRYWGLIHKNQIIGKAVPLW